MPPTVDGWIRPFYRFHWTPLLFQPPLSDPTQPTALVGLHTVGLGLGVPQDTSAAPFLRTSMTTGVADGGLSSTRFGFEFELLYLFAFLTM